MTGCRLPRQNELSTGLNIPMKWRRCVQSKKLMLLFLVLISRLATTSGRSSGSSSGSTNQCTPKEVACTCTEYTKINATGGFHRGREFKYCGGERTSTLAYNGSFCCKWKRANGQKCYKCAKLQCPYGYINKKNGIGHCASKYKYEFAIWTLIFILIPICCVFGVFYMVGCFSRAFWYEACPKRCQPYLPDEPNIPASFLEQPPWPPVASSEEAEHPPLASSKEAEHPPLASSKEADIPLATSNPIHGPMDVEMAKTKITTHNA